ncbi:MAG: hypothetical protein RLY78_1729, partial [Pseudomonadota bacterium]
MPAGGLTATAASGAPGVTPECRRQETALRGGFFSSACRAWARVCCPLIMSVNSPCPAPRQAAADAAPLPSRPPRVRDPRAAPVVAVDRHLPALPRSLLCADALRTLLARPEAALWPPELGGDGQRTGAPDDREAAVLLGLRPALDGQGGLQVLLTERTAHLRQHAGQIAFPGGRQDPQDADARATALREAHEEVGLAPSAVE